MHIFLGHIIRKSGLDTEGLWSIALSGARGRTYGYERHITCIVETQSALKIGLFRQALFEDHRRWQVSLGLDGHGAWVQCWSPVGVFEWIFEIALPLL